MLAKLLRVVLIVSLPITIIFFCRNSGADEGWVPAASAGYHIKVYYKIRGEDLLFKFINTSKERRAKIKYQLRCESRTRHGRWEKQSLYFGAAQNLNRNGDTTYHWDMTGAREYRKVHVEIISWEFIDDYHEARRRWIETYSGLGIGNDREEACMNAESQARLSGAAACLGGLGLRVDEHIGPCSCSDTFSDLISCQMTITETCEKR